MIQSHLVFVLFLLFLRKILSSLYIIYLYIFQLRNEKAQLEHTLEQEQECLVNKLMRRIEKLESETTAKQTNLETLRREKVELENTLEQEQEVFKTYFYIQTSKPRLGLS